jgi:acetoin:2,6-dichlorophenolindophenol oxidoreductase subunit alpha
MSWSNDSWRNRAWTKDAVVKMYRDMVRVRSFEEEGGSRNARGNLPEIFHSCVGQEATIVGVTSVLAEHDKMTAGHRANGHHVALGIPMKGVAAEIWGKRTGICLGKAGSKGLTDFSRGAVGANGLVAGGTAIAVGVALAQKLNGTDGVTACFIGDGAVNEGIVHEAMNWAALWKIPVIFIVENNQYAVTMWYRDTTSVDAISKRSAAYGIPGWTVDGQNVLEVADTVGKAVSRARAGLGPSLIECMTYRFTEHALHLVLPAQKTKELQSKTAAAVTDHYVPTGYRMDFEADLWAGRDPIVFLRSWTLEAGLLTSEEFSVIDADERAAAVEAWQFAEDSAWPEVNDIWSHTWRDPVPVSNRIDLSSERRY